MLLRIILLTIGVFACSTSVLMIKASATDPVALAGYRLLVAAVILSPLMLRDWLKNREAEGPLAPRRYTVRMALRAVVPGILIGLHFITWIIGARSATVANSSLIVNMVPAVMPFMLIFLASERLNVREILGTLLALAGTALLCVGDLSLDPKYFRGDLICFGSMLLFALYLALGRRNRDFPSLWLYVVPLYLVGGLTCLCIATTRAGAFAAPTRWDLLMILGLGIVPTVIGHSTMNYSMKHLRGQAVGVASLGQFIFATPLAYLLLHESPAPAFYLAAPMVVAGALIAVYGHREGN